jgi:tetratricopeptide (TPR) repeat protein
MLTEIDAKIAQNSIVEASFTEAYMTKEKSTGEKSSGKDSAHLNLKDSNARRFEALYQHGILLHEQKKLSEALDFFNQALAINPNDEKALINCGNVLYELEQYEFALAHHDFVLKTNPKCLAALNSRAVVLYCLNHHEEALATCNDALALAPNLAEALLNRGSVLNALGHHQEALQDYQKILDLNLQNTLAYCNLANLHLDMQNYESAQECYMQALILEPNNATVHWNFSIFCLLMGAYEQGWKLYESGRNASHLPRGKRKECQQPMWLGEQPITGKRILLYAEQGLGDTLQFVRYARLVAELGANVILEVPKDLCSIVQSTNPTFEVVESGGSYSEFDYHCSLMSLPLCLGTTLMTIPDETPYLFADQQKVSQFNRNNDEKIRVGLVWSGSTSHKNDANRSVALEALRPLLGLDASFHCLQKEIRDSDLATLNTLPKLQLYTDQLDDYSDTAALIETMDLIISVDTATAHLAGAMDKPTWILVPSNPDFRWLLTRDDSPWYPSAVLFRQAQMQHWDPVIFKVSNELKKVINRKQATYA